LQVNHKVRRRPIGRPSSLYTNYYTNAALFERQREYEAMAEWLYSTLAKAVRRILAARLRYDAAFHGFEALLALVFVDVQKQQDPGDHDWVPLAHMGAAELWTW